ncbi:uncharacterized protein RAG0_02635 [Rhynchosporium agropyri]|uniref:Uncharacterized protein n=1 Tax=Rhynchosporium agropyri TaxID=914238 RepID=A0A1E1K2C8_9HELO|nr:uncharacterized protein RAG0_02635 [Rhynchosporium agropyri]
MDGPIDENVTKILSKVATYGSAITSVVMNHMITAKRTPEGLEGAVNIINATVATLQQVSSHLVAETVILDGQQERKPLSRKGVQYVRLLAIECAVALVKIGPIAGDRCLNREELRAKRKLKRKSPAKRDLDVGSDIDIDSLSLDTAALAEAVEKAVTTSDTTSSTFSPSSIVSRTTVMDRPSNQVDIRSVIAFHERVIRTAGVIGIEAPGQQDIGSVRRRYGRSDSHSGTDSHSSSSYGTSDSNRDSSDYKRKKSKKSPGKLAPPTRKREPVEHVLKPTHIFGQGSTPFQRIPIDPPPIVLQNGGAGPMSIMVLKPTTPGPVILNLVLPPAYSEAQRLPSSMQLPNAGPTNGELTIPEKAEKADTNRGNTEVKVVTTKQSLGEEMKKALEDSEFILRVFIIRGHETRLVPHSAFHTLEASHMKTILSQLNDNTWYKTFSTLQRAEQQTEESDDTSILRQRVTPFCQAGGNIIDSKLRMGELQNKQLARLMDELKAFERDARFEWCWAEISLHNNVGEMQFLSQVHSAKATTIHLIAKRSLKVSYNPIQVYRGLINERPRLPSQGMPPPGIRPPPPPPRQGQQMLHQSVMRVPPTLSNPSIVLHRSPSPARLKKLRQRRNERMHASSSDDTDSGASPSDSDDADCLTTVLRKQRMQKINRKRAMKNRKGCDSDSSSSESEEDVIQVKLDLKRVMMWSSPARSLNSSD